MMHLVIVALAIFVNGNTGESAQAMAVVPSVTECAKLINDHRTPIEADDGSLWYMTQAECKVIQTR